MCCKGLMHSMSKKKRRRASIKAAQDSAVGICIAATLGLATGILLAPQSGKETRADLKNKCRKNCRMEIYATPTETTIETTTDKEI
jgi:gas vesicle protein